MACNNVVSSESLKSTQKCMKLTFNNFRKSLHINCISKQTTTWFVWCVCSLVALEPNTQTHSISLRYKDLEKTNIVLSIAGTYLPVDDVLNYSMPLWRESIFNLMLFNAKCNVIDVSYIGLFIWVIFDVGITFYVYLLL